MAEPEANELRPWMALLSAPFQPRAVIRRLAGSTSVMVTVLLFAVVGVANILSIFADAWAGWQDLQAIVLIAALAAVVSVAMLYLTSLVAALFARLFGGRAGSVTTRHALAWGAVPLFWSALIAVVLLAVGWQLVGAAATQAIGFVVGAASIWSLIITVAMLKEVAAFGVIRAAITYVLALVVASLVVAVPVRVLLWQPFNIPSGAQIPTLLVGDYLFVSKYAYGYSRFSVPFSPPLFKGRILAAAPKRGDVVVFRLPRDNRTDYVKRIIGLPGDRIQLRGGVVYINGKAVERRRVEDYQLRGPGYNSTARQYEETLPNGATYRVLDIEPNGPFDNVGPFDVPADHYFMLGDNRDNSTDSRALSAVGYVPFENLVGRAEIIFMSLSPDGDDRSGRMLTPIK